jgi:hypothetical protein
MSLKLSDFPKTKNGDVIGKVSVSDEDLMKCPAIIRHLENAKESFRKHRASLTKIIGEYTIIGD